MVREVSKRSQLAIFFAGALLVMQGSGARSVIAQEGKGDVLLITAHPTEGGGAYSRIFCVKADRFGRNVLTPEKAFAADPALSPDGKRIAFVAVAGDLFATPTDMGLYVMNADGSGRKRLAENELGDRTPAAPHWSPDGKRIAFCTRPQGRSQHKYRLYVVGADGQNLKRLDTVEAFAPVWSPDGKRLLITRLYDRGTRRWNPGLCTVDVDGTNLRELVPWGFTGAWSPDGKSLAFTAMSWPREGKVEAEPGGLFVAHADGSNPKRIVQLGKQGFHKTEPALLHFFGFQWSRDSNRLFFSRVGQRDNDLAKTLSPWTIYVIDADGRNLRQVTAADTPEYLGTATLDH